MNVPMLEDGGGRSRKMSDLWNGGWEVKARSLWVQGELGVLTWLSDTNTFPWEAARGRLAFARILPRSLRFGPGVDILGRDSRLPTSLPPDRALTMAFMVLQSESRVSRFETR